MPFLKVETLPLTLTLEVGQQDELTSKDLLRYADLQTHDFMYKGVLYLSVPTGELVIADVSRRGIVTGDCCKIGVGPFAMGGFNRMVEEIDKRFK